MLRPHDHLDKILGNPDLEDKIFRIRTSMISVNKAFGCSTPYFEHLTTIRKAIEDHRLKSATPSSTSAITSVPPAPTKVRLYELWEPDNMLIQWLEQPKVRVFLRYVMCLCTNFGGPGCSSTTH